MTLDHEKRDEGWRWLNPEALDELRKKMDALGRRAAKLGVAAPELETGETKIVKHVKWCRSPRHIGDERVPCEYCEIVGREYIEVRAVGEPVCFEGWSLVARIEHSEEGNVFYAVPGVRCPDEYRDRGRVCDHCKTDRMRKDTFVVRHVESGEHKQVGSTCIADFLGSKHPADLVSWFSWAGDWSRWLDSEMGGDWYGGLGHVDEYDIHTVLNWTQGVIHVYGWRSATKAYEDGGQSTRSIVGDCLWGRGPQCNDLRSRVGREAIDHDEIEAAAAWAKSLPEDSNDYLGNVRVIGLRGWCSSKGLGLACSILPSYRREVAKAKDAELGKKSEHVGEIKKRMNIRLKLLDIFDYDNGFTVTHIHKFIDEHDNRFTWFGSKRLNLEGFREYRATVKGHDVYQGVKQTIINRVAEVK